MMVVYCLMLLSLQKERWNLLVADIVMTVLNDDGIQVPNHYVEIGRMDRRSGI